MQIVFSRDNLHEMSNPVFCGRGGGGEENQKNITNLLPAELAQWVVTVKEYLVIVLG